MTTNYTYEELELIAEAVRNVWADCYKGGFLPGMRTNIGDTGRKAHDGLMGDVIEVVGGDFTSGLPMVAIIGMRGVEAAEEALRIESGYSPFDMKPGFLKSSKARINKAGKKYFIMSFRHMTSGTSGAMGRPLTLSMYKAAKRGVEFKEQKGTSKDPSDYGLVNSRGYEWQNGAQAGMTKVGDTRHRQYRTFRVISENSDPASWWHPGVKANPVIQSTVNYVKPYIEEGLKRAAKADVVEKIQSIFNNPILL